MIRGYVSSDEDDSDEYDFGYSDPLVFEKKKPTLPEVKTQEVKEELILAERKSNKIRRFLKAVNNVDVIALQDLISEGVSVDCTDEDGWSALMKACGMGNFEVVDFLLENGADPNKHKELLTPLMTCCTHTLVEEELKLNCVRSLLQNGADVNAKDKFWTTALMYAAGSGYKNIVNELLAVPGININSQDRDGWSALFHAVKQNDIEIVKQLMTVGADLKLKDKLNRTAINLALDKNLIQVAKALGHVEEKPPEPVKKEKLKDAFLEELPDSNGQGGFYRYSSLILNAFGQFNVKKISLPDLLNATDKDLYEVGVKLHPDRWKLLSQGIHRYHLHPWRNCLMGQIQPGAPFSFEDALVALGSFAKDLTIANASLRYVGDRIISRKMKESIDLAIEKEMFLSLLHTYQFADLLEASLSKILKHTEMIKVEIPADYIHPSEKDGHGRKSGKLLWFAVGTVITGFLFHHLSTLQF